MEYIVRVKEKLFAGLRKYIFGSRGLLAIKGDQPWWNLQNCWHNSKSAGNPILLFDFLRLGNEYGITGEEHERLIKEFKTNKKFITPRNSRIDQHWFSFLYPQEKMGSEKQRQKEKLYRLCGEKL